LTVKPLHAYTVSGRALSPAVQIDHLEIMNALNVCLCRRVAPDN